MTNTPTTTTSNPNERSMTTSLTSGWPLRSQPEPCSSQLFILLLTPSTASPSPPTHPGDKRCGRRSAVLRAGSSARHHAQSSRAGLLTHPLPALPSLADPSETLQQSFATTPVSPTDPIRANNLSETPARCDSHHG